MWCFLFISASVFKFFSHSQLHFLFLLKLIVLLLFSCSCGVWKIQIHLLCFVLNSPFVELSISNAICWYIHANTMSFAICTKCSSLFQWIFLLLHLNPFISLKFRYMLLSFPLCMFVRCLVMLVWIYHNWFESHLPLLEKETWCMKPQR